MRLNLAASNVSGDVESAMVIPTNHAQLSTNRVRSQYQSSLRPCHLFSRPNKSNGPSISSVAAPSQSCPAHLIPSSGIAWCFKLRIMSLLFSMEQWLWELSMNALSYNTQI